MNLFLKDIPKNRNVSHRKIRVRVEGDVTPRTLAEVVFENLPAMDYFVAVIEKYNPDSGWLPVARDNAIRMCTFAAANVPPNIGAPGILKGKGSQHEISNEKSLSFADQIDAQGEDVHNNNDIVSAEAAGITDPADPVNEPVSGGDGESAGLGHAS